MNNDHPIHIPLGARAHFSKRKLITEVAISIGTRLLWLEHMPTTDLQLLSEATRLIGPVLVATEQQDGM